MLNATFLIALFVILSFAVPAHSHYVWVERHGDGPARAYLGEWIDDIREKSGGMLDRIKAPRVFLGTQHRGHGRDPMAGATVWVRPSRRSARPADLGRPAHDRVDEGQLLDDPWRQHERVSTSEHQPLEEFHHGP